MASITCGNCKETHESVPAVQACYQGHGQIDKSVEKLFPTTTRQVRSGRPADEGFYHKNGEFYKVVQAKYGSGKNYAKKAVPPAVYGGKISWDYARGMVFNLSEKDKLTSEQVKEFGVLYGRCMICGRVLTREESIEKGIGPVCEEKLKG